MQEVHKLGIINHHYATAGQGVLPHILLILK